MFPGEPGVPDGVVDTSIRVPAVRESVWVVSFAVVPVLETVAVTVPSAAPPPVLIREINARDLDAPGEESKSMYIFFKSHAAGIWATTLPSVEMFVQVPIVLR